MLMCVSSEPEARRVPVSDHLGHLLAELGEEDGENYAKAFTQP